MSFEDQANDLLNSSNDSAKLVRSVHITFMMVSAYIAVILGSTSDVQLLKVSPVTLPLLNVSLPIVEFYVLTPWILLLLHFNLLLQCYLLSCKLHELNAVLEECSPEQADVIRSRLFSFSLCQNIVGLNHTSVIRFFLNSIIVFTIVIVPLVLLTWAQIRFIPYHSEEITWSHRIVVLLDCLLLWIIWPLIILPKEKLKHWIRQNTRLPGMSSKGLEEKISLREQGQTGLIIFSVIMLFISWGVAVQPQSDDSGTQLDQFFMTEILFNLPGMPFRQNLYLRDKILLEGTPSAKIEMAIKGRDEAEKQSALKEVAGLSLQGRDLRFATFKNCVMPKAKLVKAKLQGAFIDDSHMQNANFLDADLRGASLIRSQFSGSNMNYANLKKAQLIHADLQNADLEGAKLQGAVLVKANLQNAILKFSQLQGSALNAANFQKADLRGADLTGATMHGMNLAGTIIDKDKQAWVKSKASYKN